jgi:hypothetical protein
MKAEDRILNLEEDEGYIFPLTSALCLLFSGTILVFLTFTYESVKTIRRYTMEDILSMRNHVALVTGSGAGIGRSAAKILAEKGASVAILSRTESELKSLEQEITGLDRKCLIITADVSKPDEMEKACRLVNEKFGKLDTVVANAGVNGSRCNLFILFDTVYLIRPFKVGIIDRVNFNFDIPQNGIDF